MALEITAITLLASLAVRELASISDLYAARRFANWLMIPVFLLFLLYLLLAAIRIGVFS